MDKKKKKKGFTLVEMVIVVAIIAILAAVIAPNAIKQINKARVSADIANAKQIATKLMEAAANGTITSDATNADIPSNVMSDVPSVKAVSGGKFVYTYDSTNGTVTVSVQDGTDTNAKYYQLYPTVSTTNGSPYANQ
jgi:type IV pilus assembly protein PilA